MKIGRQLLIVGGIFGLAGAGLFAAVNAEPKSKYPSPKYEVTFVIDKHIEIRRYAPRVVAQVQVRGTDKSSLNQAFRILADYIFGKNKKQAKSGGAGSSEKIAMTSPVLSQKEKISMTSPVTTSMDRSAMTMRFFMPPQYSLSNLPSPLDDRIKFTELPEEHFAAIRFAGTWDRSNFDKHAKTLLQCLERNNMKPAGEPFNAYYDPPFTPFFMRHNEVLVPVTPREAQ